MTIDRSNSQTAVLIAALLLLTTAVYWAGLSGPLLLDDLPQLNSLIAASGDDAGELFRNHIISSSGPLGRPVAMITFIADAVVHGSDTWWWKLTNLMLHLISGLLVFWLTTLLVRASSKDVAIDPRIAGVAVAALWLLHPLHVSTVLYTVQRMTELSTLFVFAGLVSYAKGRLLQERSGVSGWLLIGLGFGLFFPLAIFSKENALLFPVYCALIELLILRFRGPGRIRQQVKLLHGVLLAGFVAVTAYTLVNFPSVVLDSYVHRDFTLSERVLTQFRVVITYLSQLVLPFFNEMGFFHDDVAVSTSLMEPPATFLSAFVLLVLAASAIYLRGRVPLYAFGVLFFFASHVMESSILGLELMYEHRNYAGSFGIQLALFAGASHFIRHKKGLLGATAILAIAFSLQTWQRSNTWSTPEGLYTYMHHVHPESPRLNLVFANVYAAAGNFGRARAALAKVGSGLGPKLHGLFLDCSEHRSVVSEDVAAIALEADIISAHVTSSARALVREAISGRCDVPKDLLAESLGTLLALPARSPTDAQALHFTQAELLESTGDVDSSVAHYDAAFALSPGDARPLYIAADMLLRNARLDEARRMLGRASEIENSTRIQRKELARGLYLGLGRSYATAGRSDAALGVYREAMTAMPRRTQFYVAAADLLLGMRQFETAATILDEMRSNDPKDLDEYRSAVQRVEAALREQLGASAEG